MTANPAGMVRGLYAAITLVDRATAPITQVNQAMDRSKPRVQALQQDVDKLQQQTDRAGGILGGVTRRLEENQAAVAALGAAMTAAGAAGAWMLTNQAKRAGEYESMLANFRKALGDNATATLEEMDQAAAGTVSAYEQIKQANYAMMMGIDAEAIPAMMEAARAASKRFGGDVSYYYQSIVTGTARQSKLILDNLGIIVDAEKAYKDYAASIGKSTGALTENERKLAYQQEVMRQAKAMVEETEMAYGSYGDEMARIAALQEEVSQEIAGTTIPAQMLLLETISQVLGVIKDAPAPIKTVVGLLALVTTGALGTIGPLLTAAASAKYLGLSLSVSSIGIKAFAASIGTATLAAAPWLLVIGAIIAALWLLHDIWANGWDNSAIKGAVDWLAEFFKPAIEDINVAMDWLRGLIDRVRDGFKAAGAAINQALENPAIQVALTAAKTLFSLTPMGIGYNAAQALLPLEAAQGRVAGPRVDRLEVNVNIPEVATRMDDEEFKRVVKEAGGLGADEAERRLTQDLRAHGAGAAI